MVGRVRWRAAAILLAGYGVFGPRAAGAEEPRVRLAWARGDGAETCPDERAVEAAVRTRLGYDPFTPDSPVGIEGTVTRSGTAWHAELRVRDDAGALLGHRVLDTQAEGCGPLGEAVVLAIALTIDPTAEPHTRQCHATHLPPSSRLPRLPRLDVGSPGNRRRGWRFPATAKA